MDRLRSYVEGRWHTASSGWVPLVNPCTEEVIAEASSAGIDCAGVLDHARRKGGPALRGLTVAGRAELLERMSRVLHEHREELIELSLENTGTTRKDAKFDIDGATFTLAHYAGLGRSIGERHFFVDGEGERLGRSARFWGQHLMMPRSGAAVLINAFNFPAWGFGEKAACALLAGMPVIAKPATSSALLAARCIEIVIEAGILPEGALSLICGSTGNLLDLLGGQDVLAFTGSASTALSLRAKTNLLAASTRVNIEADSLNPAVMGPDVEPGSESWELFLRDVEREITQKSGQKCTAVRRVIVPSESMDRVQEELCQRLERVVVGNPKEPSVTMGPLATANQLREAETGVARLREEAALVHGSGERIDGKGNESGKGFFFGPTLLRSEGATGGAAVHELEVFGPVATLVGYDGTAADAAGLVARGGGCLVTSVYSDDPGFLEQFLAAAPSSSGRIYIGSEKVAAQLPGSGVAHPALLHGGPGRAGGGEELGGLRGLALYLQRVALSGDRAVVERLAGLRDGAAGRSG
jgi:oxepin-CoA hydrolase/3-oxo-5,6-dehydrosuberyl-CoA semialdehyde dehydrogenase